MDKPQNSNNNLDPATCIYSQKLSTSTLPTDLSVTPGAPISNANVLADSLGVSPLYRQIDSARWASAANVYHSSRCHSPVPSSGAFNFDFGESVRSPLSVEEIADKNRAQHKENEVGESMPLDDQVHGPLELEVISTLHELAPYVESLTVSEILPKTAELIFLNLKTKEDLPFTLELTMKGWRVCSSRSDCIYGDYLNLDLHTKYHHSAKDLLKAVSKNCDFFTDCLTERLKKLQAQENEEAEQFERDN